MDNKKLFGFCGLFGSNRVRVLKVVRVTKRSGCSVDFVEKMWKSLWGNRWEICGKVFGILWKSKFYTKNKQVFRINGVYSGKISNGFAHKKNRGMSEVLHIFHNVYYYNY